ncbi:hypothetical protein JI435_414400 [Parastagonospora nodorum SN15]|uniref:Uncharacterized protein n=1 Tax=Phaeosphaeria nodorum (strain SN15 / ATCC MYA-4574 / FGSC 10173) TaxID=321614 RepID=A0A7U2F769_PHANO|nr:hypothetical protein JI435_414400 [Parastagonospora nodorum SN15]
MLAQMMNTAGWLSHGLHPEIGRQRLTLSLAQ